MEIKKMNYKGWSNCYQVSNGLIELIAVTDIGPRILHFGFTGQENQFRVWPEQVGKTGGADWRIYGGHRFWHAPEEKPRTYFPDNGPVEFQEHQDFVRLVQPIEPTTGIQKEIDLRPEVEKAQVTVTHRFYNHNLWPIELAPWALTVVELGGVAIIPFPPRGTHDKDLLPTNTLTMWAYTDMSDTRWTWGQKYILLRQDVSKPLPQKIGVSVPDGWAAYARNGSLFVKKAQFVPGGRYPDFGCSVETFTKDDMLELETLGPLELLGPGASMEYTEEWLLFSDVPMPKNDLDVDQFILPNVI